MKLYTNSTLIFILKAGYGTPSGPGGYQGWGAPPGPQGQQMPPPQWGSNYGGPPQQQGYGSYGKNPLDILRNKNCIILVLWMVIL